MLDGSVPERVRDALIEIVANAPDGYRHYSWGGWKTEVGRLVPDYTPADLVAVFKLLNGDMVELTKPGTMPRHYSGDQADDDAFFYRGDLNAALTPKGQTYWGRIRVEKKKAAIGFA
jgi:hypothetical protein